MIVLTTSAVAQKISVIPRQYDETAFKMDIRDDSTNKIVTYNIPSDVTVGNYLEFNNVFSPVLVEAHFYDLSLYIDFNFWNTNNSFWQLYNVLWNVDGDVTEDIFKDRVFCTDQGINQLNNNERYKLNEGQYTTYNGFNNEFTIR